MYGPAEDPVGQEQDKCEQPYWMIDKPKGFLMCLNLLRFYFEFVLISDVFCD